MTGRLQDKVVIITGAAGGQGFAATRIFASEGARVAMLDLDEGKVAAAAAEIGAPGLLAVACDVADSASVQAAVARSSRSSARSTSSTTMPGPTSAAPGRGTKRRTGPRSTSPKSFSTDRSGSILRARS